MNQPSVTDFKMCCVLVFFLVGSYVILIAGFILLISTGSPGVGVPLIFLGGILALASTFLACMSCWLRRHKTFGSDSELESDAPPSYRISWRRSFLRRGVSRNPSAGPQQMTRHPGRSMQGISSRGYENIPDVPQTIYTTQGEIVSSSPSSSRSVDAPNHSHINPLDNLVDNPVQQHENSSNANPSQMDNETSDLPPSYDVAVKAMDNASYIRVVSDLHSPSISSND